MKIQCDCGGKYAFDATPDMVRHPVTFACPECGADLSARIHEAVQQQFGDASAPVALSVSPPSPGSTDPQTAPPTEIAPPPTAPTRIRIHVPGAGTATPPASPVPADAPPSPQVQTRAEATVNPVPATAPASPPQVRLSRGGARAAAPEDVKDDRFCPKHPQQRVIEKCRVCGKEICPKCMQLFGYVCSPHCKEKAELQGLEIPVYAGQRDVAQNREWGKVVLVSKLAALVVLILVGVWCWYAWFGSRPRPVFTVRFDNEPAMSGMSAVCPEKQIVFIHGDKLARYDLKSGQAVWQRQLLDKKQIADQAAAEVKAMQEAAAKGESVGRIPDAQELTKAMTRAAERSLKLETRGENLWVLDGARATRYDWATGEPKATLELDGDPGSAIRRGDELEFQRPLESGRLNLTRLNLVTGKLATTELGEKPKVGETAQAASTRTNQASKSAKPAATSSVASGPRTQSLDPRKMANALEHASPAAKLAAPATISVSLQQQRALQAMEDQDTPQTVATDGRTDDLDTSQEFGRVIPTSDGFIQLSVEMLERRIIERSAIKPVRKGSALSGNVSVTSTYEVANELLNEMTRNAGGDTVREDASRYRAKVHLSRAGQSPADWEGEVVGRPALYPQASVNVLVAGKTLIVLDRTNQKRWESTLSFPLAGSGDFRGDEESAVRTGLGPVVEHGDTLYVFDQGVLSAFDTATGNARWRLPSVGISGLFFDEKGMMYVNTTTASPDQIKYSKQIDVTSRTDDVILKLDSRTGAQTWKYSLGGRLAYLSGKYIYTVSFLGPLDDGEELSPEMVAMGVETKPYIRIRRINPRNGRVMWDYYQPRGPLDVRIQDNTFQLVLKKEVQVLKFLSF